MGIPGYNDPELARFLDGKTLQTRMLFDHLVAEFAKVGKISLHPAKTMIGIANTHKRIAYITQLGKNFVHITFMFKQPYPDNLCFTKIAAVPGSKPPQFNHHFRMYNPDDINAEVRSFMQKAYAGEM